MSVARAGWHQVNSIVAAASPSLISKKLLERTDGLAKNGSNESTASEGSELFADSISSVEKVAMAVRRSELPRWKSSHWSSSTNNVLRMESWFQIP